MVGVRAGGEQPGSCPGVALAVLGEDDVDIVDTEDNQVDASAAYMADGSAHREDREIELSPELGLAIEKLPEGFTAKSLWSIVSDLK